MYDNHSAPAHRDRFPQSCRLAPARHHAEGQCGKNPDDDDATTPNYTMTRATMGHRRHLQTYNHTANLNHPEHTSQHRAAQHNTVHHSTAQHITAQHITSQVTSTTQHLAPHEREGVSARMRVQRLGRPAWYDQQGVARALAQHVLGVDTRHAQAI